MTKYFTNNFSVINIYKEPSAKSEVVTQMIYGESFSISKRTKKWIKIKIKEDHYKGFIRNKNYKNYLKPTHKVNSLKVNVYRYPNKKEKTYELSFGSKIRMIEKKYNFLRFQKGWLSTNDVKPISYKDKDPFKIIGIFKNIKYKWGGKSFKGIDCSALIQVCLNFNNKYCPRDSRDQIKYFKKNVKLKNIKKNDIIFWKGHVAVALSKNKLIHAYGPLKKTLIMNIHETIDRIKRTSGLRVIAIKRI